MCIAFSEGARASRAQLCAAGQPANDHPASGLSPKANLRFSAADTAALLLALALSATPAPASAQDALGAPAPPPITASDLVRDPSIVTPYGEETRRPAPLTESLAAAMPNFLDGAALNRLKDALHAAITPSGEAESARPAANGGAFVFGSGLASVLPSLPQIPIFGGGAAAPASPDFSGTLTPAPRGAGARGRKS